MMELSNFTAEQIEKATACTTTEELLALAKTEGISLTDEQLEQMSGGKSWIQSFGEGMN